jgi:hypothetical protein
MRGATPCIFPQLLRRRTSDNGSFSMFGAGTPDALIDRQSTTPMRWNFGGANMIAIKAVAAITMTGLGSLAAGTGAYFEMNPRAMTREVQTERAPPAIVPAPVLAPVVEKQTDEVLTIDPVVITGRERRAPKAVAEPSRPVEGPCSDWQGMTTGPAGRKVRLLCPR